MSDRNECGFTDTSESAFFVLCEISILSHYLTLRCVIIPTKVWKFGRFNLWWQIGCVALAFIFSFFLLAEFFFLSLRHRENAKHTDFFFKKKTTQKRGGGVVFYGSSIPIFYYFSLPFLFYFFLWLFLSFLFFPLSLFLCCDDNNSPYTRIRTRTHIRTYVRTPTYQNRRISILRHFLCWECVIIPQAVRKSVRFENFGQIFDVVRFSTLWISYAVVIFWKFLRIYLAVWHFFAIFAPNLLNPQVGVVSYVPKLV